MAFTGRLGTRSSKLGNVVLGISDGLGVGPLGFDVHVLSADEVRVRYTVKVTDTALDIGFYSLTSIAPPGTAITPAILSARWYDDRRRSVILQLSQNLTYGTDYSLEIDGVGDENGDVLTQVAKNFTANVQAPPKAVGAWQSKRGFLDILFDKPVGLNSFGASFEIRDSSSPGPGVPMAQTPWAAEAITEETLRVSIPGGTPGAVSYSVDFSGVTDTSLNTASGSVPVTLSIRSATPHSLAAMLQLQIVDAYVVGGDFEYLKFGIVRVFFNGPAAVDQAFPDTQFTLYHEGPHPKADTVNTITTADAVDLPTLITLCTDIKARFNAHLVEPGVHFSNDPGNSITSPVPTDLPTCVDLVNEAQDRFLAHYRNTLIHIYEDSANEFTKLTVGAGNQALAIAVANQYLKAKFNSHILAEQQVSFVLPQSGIMNYVSAHATEPNTAYDVDSAYTYFADLHVRMYSAKAYVRVEANVPSEDGFSSTSSANFTGNYTARAYADPAHILSYLVSTDEGADFRLSGEIVVPSPSAVSVSGPSGAIDIDPTRVTASLRSVASNLNFLTVAFNSHIGGVDAGHEQTDIYNNVIFGVFSPDLQDVIVQANVVKAAINAHVGNLQAPFHLHTDPRTVTAPDATDLPSLVTLVDQMRTVYLRHNQEGPHLRPGYRVYNSGMLDTLVVPIRKMVDEVPYSLGGTVRSRYLSIPGNGEIGVSYPFQSVTTLRYLGDAGLSGVDLSVPFMGMASRPSLASALPKSGLEFGDDGDLHFESDQVEVYFSKPMAMVPLDSSNLPVTGGSLLQKESDWIDPRTASVRVVSMESIPYAVVAIGLTDESGNPVY